MLSNVYFKLLSVNDSWCFFIFYLLNYFTEFTTNNSITGKELIMTKLNTVTNLAIINQKDINFLIYNSQWCLMKSFTPISRLHPQYPTKNIFLALIQPLWIWQKWKLRHNTHAIKYKCNCNSTFILFIRFHCFIKQEHKQTLSRHSNGNTLDGA